MRRFDLIVFDNDGVLVDSEPHAHPVLVRLLGEYGWSITLDESRDRFLGTSIAFVRETAERVLGGPLPSTFEERYRDDLFDAYERGLRAMDGIRTVLEQLDVPFCVASSGTHDRIRRSLCLTGLWEYFDGRAFSAEDVVHGKPAPDLFLHAAASMGVRPDRCVVVEDSRFGIEAAARAGMESVGFAFRTPHEQLAQASLGVVERMSDLVSAIRKANA